MEHRQHFRYELAVDLLIYRRGLPVATGRLRNISRDGLFVETGYAELQPHQRLECAFRRHEDTGQWQRIGAHVCRSAGDGVGLALDESDAAGSAVLQALVDTCSAAPHAGPGDFAFN